MDECFISVPVSRYQRLIEIAERDKAFAAAVFASTWLSDERTLRYQPDMIRNLVEVMFPEEHDARLSMLIEREERAEAERRARDA